MRISSIQKVIVSSSDDRIRPFTHSRDVMTIGMLDEARFVAWVSAMLEKVEDESKVQ